MAPKTWLLARGLLAIVLMLGFYALAISVALGLLAVAYVQVVYLQARMFNLMVFCVVGALAILWSRAMHSRPRVNVKRSASFAQP